MSPEYAVNGKFSAKSDVFSFGVLLLEIISGQKNRSFHHPDHHHSLSGHVSIPNDFVAFLFPFIAAYLMTIILGMVAVE